MNKIYKITKSQLVTMWVFVSIILVLLFIRFNDYCYIEEISCKKGGSIIPIIIILFLIIFYTIGWKNNNKTSFFSLNKFKKYFSKKDLIDSKNQLLVESQEKKLKGIGGWLILVFIGLLYSLCMLAYNTYSFVRIFMDGTLNTINDFGVKGISGVMTFEMWVQALMFLAVLFLIYLFFNKDKNFPDLFIIFLASNIIIIALDLYFISSLNYPTTEIRETLVGDSLKNGYTDLARAVIVAIIWISYMTVSKRVKLTFVENNVF